MGMVRERNHYERGKEQAVTTFNEWLTEQEKLCREATKGPWKTTARGSDAQGPMMVMHHTKRGVAIASLSLCFSPRKGIHDPVADKPVPCPEAGNGMTYRPERVANARFIAASRLSLPQALQIIARWRLWLDDVKMLVNVDQLDKIAERIINEK
jgi:hypothetical protein